MTLDEWAEKWGIPDAAIRDLAMFQIETKNLDPKVFSERGVSDRVRLEAASAGWHLWRNNRGAFKDDTGRWVRYGLANDSKPLGDSLKSGDLFGWKPRLIKLDDVGKIIAQTVNRECKRPDWRYSGSPEEEAQMRWHTLILASGGDSAIVNSAGSIHA